MLADIFADEINIHLNGTRIFVAFLFCATLAALAAAILFGYVGDDPPAKVLISSFIGLPLFGYFAGMSGYQMMTIGNAAVTISKAGYWDRRISKKPIPWHAIDKVRVWTKVMPKRLFIKGPDFKYIELHVPLTFDKDLGIRPRARKLKDLSAGQGGQTISFPTGILKVSHEELLAEINARVDAAHSA